jgi:diguanylate cyclase (GGDEF)-like protein
MLTPKTDPTKQLPGTTARFVAGEQGLMDFRPEEASPQAPAAERRDPQVSDAVTEEAQKFIEDIRKTAELDEAQERQIRQLVNEARRNPLTGGMNRNAFEHVFDAVRRRAKKTKKPVSVIALDAANLKTFNDVIGESAGDEYLRRVQRAIEGALRKGGDDRIGDAFHYGGDEWAVVLPDTDAAGAEAVRARIEEAFGQEEIVPGVSAFLVGGSETIAPGSRREWRSILDKAAKAMKTRKAEKKAAMGEPTTRAEAEARAAEAVREENYDVDDVQPERQGPRVREALRQIRQKQQELQEVDQRVAAQASRARQAVKQTPPMEGTQHKRRVPQTIEEFLTPLSSRIRDLSPSMFNRLMRMEFNTGVARENLKRELSEPAGRLREALRRVKQEDVFKLAVLNQDFDAARSLIEGINSDLVEDFNIFVGTFKNLLDNQRAAGVTIGEVENYWPRFVKDYNAFDAIFGSDKGRFERAFDLAKKVKGRRMLNKEEQAEIANSVIQGFGPQKPGAFGPPNARSRRIDRISQEQLEHYLDPFEAAMRYVDGATYSAERARFLGRNHTLENMDETIGAIVQEEIELGNLKKADQDEMMDMLTTRFTADMLKPSKAVRNFKQLIYLTTLGQFRSTLTQLTDSAMTAAEHGIGPWFQGMRRALRLTPRDRRFVMEDIGIHDHGEEFKDVGQIAESLDWTLNTTQFKRIDRLGKEGRINAAWVAMEKAAARPRSARFRKLEREYRPVLGDEAFDQVMHDLRQGKKTEDIRYLLFLDLTKVQPVTTSQMPQKYLSSPGGRILYALKTFTITQLDHVRRDMVRKILTPGQRREGLSHLARYLVLFGLIGLGKDWVNDWIRGKPLSARQLPDRSADALLGCVGLNRYTVEEAWSRPSDAAINFVAPPMSWLDATVQDVTSDAPGLRSIRNIPVVGELIYYWAPFGRGYYLNKKEAKREYRELLAELRSEAADAVRIGDMGYARRLIAIYNERRKQGPGDGRKGRLTVRTLRRDIRRDAKRRREQE